MPLSTNENDDALAELHHDGEDSIIADNEDNPKCEINSHVEYYRLCKAKVAHDAVFGKN